MNAAEPRITDYMVKTHIFVRPSSPLKKALSAMEKSESHYLPVMSGKKVVGLLKDHTSRLAASWLGPEEFTVADVMSSNPAVTQPETSSYEVLDNTPDNLYGCTIVQDEKGAVVGMFTPKEALMAIHFIAAQNRAKQ